MEILFLICAAFGGTVMVLQFLLSFAGFGGEDADFDTDSVDLSQDIGELADAADGGDAEMHVDGSHGQGHAAHGSTAFFKMLSLRAIIAALTFFGLAGLASLSADFNPVAALVIASGSGIAAMYAVYFMMQSLTKLTADGTERITRAIGTEGIVYLTIPGHQQGAGKVHLTLQGRLVEYEAMTAGEKLPTGTRIVVVDVVGSDRVEVEAAPVIAR